MASKAIYVVVAVAGIALASGAAWFVQQPRSPGNAAASTSGSAGAPAGPSAAKPPSVETASVEVRRLTDDTQAVGSLKSRRGVVLRPEVSGRITQLNFTDGQRVKKGQTLVQFDDKLPLAQVQQSVAELSIARANQTRNQELVAQNFVSQRSLDESAANLQVAQAKLDLAKATAARLKIVAPFDGIAGIRLVNVGDYLRDGADIVNIEDIDAIFVDFRLPERFQSRIARGQTALIDIDALPGRRYSAQIQAIDPLIDANGRSVGVRACIDNRQLQLRPGMFARVNAVFDVRENALVVPEEAIVPQGGKQYVIKLLDTPAGAGTKASSSKTTQRVEVKVGLRIPGRVEILQGLSTGDTVITSGQQRVQKDGSRVDVVAGAAQAPATGPAPAGSASKLPVASTASGVNPCGALIVVGSQRNDQSPALPVQPPKPAPRNPA